VEREREREREWGERKREGGGGKEGGIDGGRVGGWEGGWEGGREGKKEGGRSTRAVMPASLGRKKGSSWAGISHMAPAGMPDFSKASTTPLKTPAQIFCFL
jgi:hypothetical protein